MADAPVVHTSDRPSIAQQLRADRRRRQRRQRRRRHVAGATTVGALALLALQQGPDLGTDGAAGASADAGPTVEATAGSTTSSVVTALDPGLVAAFGAAELEAAAAGHTLVITSGFRSAEHQQQLLDAEIVERGSVEEAMRWVFPPDRSMHVQGLAIDVGNGGAADWLDREGRRFGLCRTLDWEWWHFEWRQRWQDAGACPPPATDPSEAPGV